MYVLDCCILGPDVCCFALCLLCIRLRIFMLHFCLQNAVVSVLVLEDEEG